MFGLESLDILIGLITVYLVFALACTAIIEALAAWLNVRSNNFDAAINEFLAGDLKDNQTFVKAFYAHPLVQTLSKGENGRPSYIPPDTIGKVMQSLVTVNGTIESLAEAVKALPGTEESNRIKGLLTTVITQVNEDSDAFRKALETHFNTVMDRASGWVKRHQQTMGLIVSTILVLAANVDTVDIVTSLSSNPEVRATIVKTGNELLTNAQNDVDKEKPDQNATTDLVKKAEEGSKATKDALEAATSITKSAGLQLGWKTWLGSKPTFSDFLAKAAGLVVSIFAISLGAPFWFDLLQRFMQLRATGSREATDKNKKK